MDRTVQYYEIYDIHKYKMNLYNFDPSVVVSNWICSGGATI